MDKRRILILSGAFYPNISPRSYRTTELAKELARQGHEVTLYVPTEGKDYSVLVTEKNLRIFNLGPLKWRNVSLRGGRIELFFRKALSRGLKLLFEWPDIELMFRTYSKLKNEQGYDLLISIAVPYPIHWGVAKAYGGKHKIADCWVADCGDPYMGDTADSFRKMFYFKYIEEWFCRKADFISVPFVGAIPAYYEEFHYKIKIIPQGFQLEDIKIPDYIKTCDYPVFAYAGGFIPGKRDPLAFLSFLSSSNRKFKFIVYTSQNNILSGFKETLGEKLEVNSLIPREELLVVLAKMDFLINFDNNTPTQLPSKLIDYSITGRPVLNINSELDTNKIIKFLEGDYSTKMNLPQTQEYNIKSVAGKFIGLLSEK